MDPEVLRQKVALAVLLMASFEVGVAFLIRAVAESSTERDR